MPHPPSRTPQGFKVGLCSQPPVGMPYSLLALSNNCCITDTLGALQARFNKLYKRRWARPCAQVHAFTHACSLMAPAAARTPGSTALYYTCTCLLTNLQYDLINPRPTRPHPRLFLHHYEEYMERAGFDEAAETIAALAESYRAADGARPPPVARLRPRGVAFA